MKNIKNLQFGDKVFHETCWIDDSELESINPNETEIFLKHKNNKRQNQ